MSFFVCGYFKVLMLTEIELLEILLLYLCIGNLSLLDKQHYNEKKESIKETTHVKFAAIVQIVKLLFPFPIQTPFKAFLCKTFQSSMQMNLI